MDRETIKLGLRLGQNIFISQDQDLVVIEQVVKPAKMVRISAISQKTLAIRAARIQMAGNVAVDRAAPQQHQIVRIGPRHRIAKLENQPGIRHMAANVPGCGGFSQITV